MKPELLEKLVEAVLYEGHILYPYRPSSQKNRQRFTFGRVYPEAYSRAQDGVEPCRMQTQCLVRPAGPGATVRMEVRFLHPIAREIARFETPLGFWSDHSVLSPSRVVPTLELEGKLHQTWQEAIERKIAGTFAVGDGTSCEIPFSFPAQRTAEPIREAGGSIPAMIIRRHEAAAGTVTFSAQALEGCLRLSVQIVNHTPVPTACLADADAVLLRTFASTHTLLQSNRLQFLSATAPPPELAAAASGCRNLGTWPVLVGDEARGDCDTLLSSPIILPDYPQLAPESPGSLFDGTEIDEILTLRILTMTDEEKREMRHVDESARRLLERTEALPAEQMMGLHGAMRAPRSFDDDIFGNGRARLESVVAGGISLRAGDKVWIRPKARADVMDLALAGKCAVIEALEEDAEGRVHLALVVEDDPGRDLGFSRQTGHRFFYGLDEIEPCPKEEPTA